MELVTFPDLAARLDLPVNRVHQLVRDGHLIATTRDGVRCVPAEFVHDGAVVKGLSGVIHLLRDAQFADDEIVAWLFREDDTLPGGSPVEALRANHSTEVKRRAQVAGY